MKPNSWIYYQGQVCDDLHSCQLVPWDLHFPEEFVCSNVIVSDPSLKTKACALILSEKSSQFHLNWKELIGYKVIYSENLIGLAVMPLEANKFGTNHSHWHLQRGLIANINISQKKTKVKERTKQVVRLTAMGLTSSQIAETLFLSSRGVDYHIEIAKRILGANNKSAMVYQAMRQHWFA